MKSFKTVVSSPEMKAFGAMVGIGIGINMLWNGSRWFRSLFNA